MYIRLWILLTKINEKEIPLTSLVDGFSKGERIIDIYSIKDFTMEKMLYFFTKKGWLKDCLKEYGRIFSSARL